MRLQGEISRRNYIKATGVIAAGVWGINHFDVAPTYATAEKFGFGPLVDDPAGILDLPIGFKYTAFSKTGDLMDDNLKVPGAHDGMGAFSGPRGTTILVRNHELSPDLKNISSHLGDPLLLQNLPTDRIYDVGRGKQPAIGGTTTLIYDTKRQRLLRHSLSLTGTTRNCAGGPTPWRSWLTCEETVDRMGELIEKDHGYIFEVPARVHVGLARPVPYKAMGRFNHEAVAIDPRTGIVYLTEDREDGIFYRFLPQMPRERGKLVYGGRLQAMKLKGERKADTRNWPDADWMPVRTPLDVEWVDIENVEAPDDDLRKQGADEKNAAVFARGEGIWYERGVIYWACTSGGPNKEGQIFRYYVSDQEGNPEENISPGRLEIFSQPNNSKLLKSADNLVVAPWGDIIVCEDTAPENHLVGITPEGILYRLARNALNNSEFAGSTFSPDGSTLFVNIQRPGITLAITGPWTSLPRADS